MLGAVDAFLECGTGGVVPIFIVMGFDGFDGLLLRIRSSMTNLASFIHDSRAGPADRLGIQDLSVFIPETHGARE